MNINCTSCHVDFSIDETNLDTDRVDCPRCSWPNLVMRFKKENGHFGHFMKSKNNNYGRHSRRWPGVK